MFSLTSLDRKTERRFYSRQQPKLRSASEVCLGAVALGLAVFGHFGYQKVPAVSNKRK